MKIITPSTSFIKEGNRGVFVFKPKEIGMYKVTAKTDGGMENYWFKVVESLKEGGRPKKEINSIKEYINNFNC